jgi:ribose/xylose/arabinose/galactoside ABC-type transport system permease subunit
VAGIAGGTMKGEIPHLFDRLSSANEPTGIAPAWGAVAAIIVLADALLRGIWFGCRLSAPDSSHTAVECLLISGAWRRTRRFAVSSVAASLTDILFLGYTGSGYARVGEA